MKSEIAEAFLSLVKEKGMDKADLTKIIEEIFLAMIKKKYGTTDNFNVFVNMEKGEIEITHSRTVVETVADETSEIDLATARLEEDSFDVGDEYLEFIPIESFGRRLIISAKQNLNQKIKEVEKEHIYEEFKNRVGEIVRGEIRQINRDEIFLSVDGNEVVLPKNEQIPNERYRRGDSMRGIIKEVRQTARLPEIVISRADPLFLVRLFELEVPEISDGIIEIKGIAREPGERTKIAVYSHDKRIDAVGACVGMKGMRIQGIVKELNNEKIDIINWNSEPEIFIARALSPAKPKRLAILEEERRVIAVMDDEQISLAIGKGGQNRRLAVRLTGFDIQTVKEEEYQKLMAEEARNGTPLEEAEGLTEKIVNALHMAGFETVQQVLNAGAEKLVELPGIGEKTAEKILRVLENQID